MPQITDLTPDPERALVIAVQLSQVSDDEFAASCAELARLADTRAITVVETMTQKRGNIDALTFVGTGKLGEIASWLEQHEVDVVIVDADLTPKQHRHLERTLKIDVLDRTGIILEIFESRARTREAMLEVEIARLRYELPRLRDDKSKAGRRGGGGRGERGHTNVELDKSRIRTRIAQLEDELAGVQRRTDSHRDRRDDVFLVALVGYTNAGKSSLMRGMTGSDVYVEDQLFATLGTTVRQLDPPASPPILLTDTVGFIKNLPHELVASFRSTLEEARDADLLVIVVDAADANWPEELAVTQETLASIGADRVASRIVLNKIDLLTEEQRAALHDSLPAALQLSALDPAGRALLRSAIVAAQQAGLRETTLRLPFRAGHLTEEIHKRSAVLDETHDERGTVFRLRARDADLERWRKHGAT